MIFVRGVKHSDSDTRRWYSRQTPQGGRHGIGLMTTGRFDGDEDVRSLTRDEADTSAESTAGRPDTDAIVNKGAERTDSGETAYSRDGTNRTGAVVVDGTVLGGTTETVRRLGIDRHNEAGVAEQANIEAYAKQVGGTGVYDGSSAFTPDSDINGITETESSQKISSPNTTVDRSETVL